MLYFKRYFGEEVKTYPIALTIGVSTSGEVGALTIEGLLLLEK